MKFNISNPILTSKRGVFSYLTAWALLALVHILVLRHLHELSLPWRVVISDGLVFNLIFAAGGLSLWYSCRFLSLEKSSVLRVVLSHVVGAMLESLLWVAAAYLILKNIDFNYPEYSGFLFNSLIIRWVLGIVLYFTLVTFFYFLIYYNNFQEKRIQEAELKSLVKEAELRTLKFQINPHFIFNSLNSINSLTITNPPKAGEMTIKLANYLRYTLSKNDHQKSTLKEEIDSAKLYLDIEKVRFGDKFEFVDDIDSTCLSALVPNMLLQPLFENAIKHGVYESLETVHIRLECRRRGEFLQLIVENDFDPEAAQKKGPGIGLTNIKNRLQITYSQDNLLQIDRNGHTFRVTVFIPMT
jgi:sensor histidine kinase YesM